MMTTLNEQMREKLVKLIRYCHIHNHPLAVSMYEVADEVLVAKLVQLLVEAHAAGRQEILDSARTPADIKRDIDSGALTNPVIVFDRMLKAMAPANGVETPEDIAMDIVERWSQNYMDTMRPAAHHDLLARITSAIRIVREGK